MKYVKWFIGLAAIIGTFWAFDFSLLMVDQKSDAKLLFGLFLFLFLVVIWSIWVEKYGIKMFRNIASKFKGEKNDETNKHIADYGGGGGTVS